MSSRISQRTRAEVPADEVGPRVGQRDGRGAHVPDYVLGQVDLVDGHPAGVILLTHPADFAGLNEEYARWFPSEPPTRYVAKLGVELPGLFVSIRMTAFIA